ncbi:MAG: hypothetical protein F4Z95_04535 [Gammaproteobacteria bacterium]|nr:hypothetical protein [Gammaproteobacteria bacterium]
MKFLIDECLSPTLATIARTRGFAESTHVIWIGLQSRQDWALVRRAVDDGYVLVTQDRTDFTSLMERERSHPGLVCVNVAHGLMSLGVQQALFEQALRHIADDNLEGEVVEITLASDGTVRADRYRSSPP